MNSFLKKQMVFLAAIVALSTFTFGQDFAVTLNAAGGSGNYDLNVGMSPTATDGYDEGIDLYAPPAPPPPAFDAAIGWGGDRYYTQIVATTTETVEFDIQLQYPEENIITLSWDNAGWAALGSFVLQDAFGGAMINVNMLEQTSIELTNPAFNTLKLFITATPPLQGPTADFTGDPLSGFTPLAVSFTNTSTEGDEGIVSIAWDFGDGGTSTDASPTYTYQVAGEYTVSLTVIDDNGLADSEVKDAYIVVNDPVDLTADFSANPTFGTAPLTVQLTDLSYPTTGYEITAWAWEFGDGSTSTDQNPAHDYAENGSYTVSLTVTDATGTDTKTATDFILVSDIPIGDPNIALSMFVEGPDFGYNLGFGFSPNATDGYDEGTDQYAPPAPPPPSFDAALTWPLNSERYFTQILNGSIDDLTEHIYGVSLQYASDNLITITWDNTDWDMLGSFRLTDAFDGALGVDVDMTQQTSLILDNPAYTSLKLWVTPSGVSAPNADFTSDVTTGFPGMTVNFSDATVPGSGDLISWAWDFGDGGTSTEQNPVYVYETEGSYSVSLTVSDVVGFTSTETKTDFITVNPFEGATADFSADVTSGPPPLTVNFSDLSITDAGFSIVSWAWDFGDGGTSTEQNPAHIFENEGQYTVSLTVEDENGFTDTMVRDNYIHAVIEPLYAPVNLSASVSNQVDVSLEWDEPIDPNNAWLNYDSGENNDGIGLTDGGTFYVAARWEPFQLTPYDGMFLDLVKFFPRSATAEFTIKVWYGADAGTLVHEQAVTDYIPESWNEITLSSAVEIDATQELWIGYELTHAGGEYPAGTDGGPAEAGYGDMLSMDGVAWESMATAYGLNYNWNIQGHLALDGRSLTLASIPDDVMPGTTILNNVKHDGPFEKGGLGIVDHTRSIHTRDFQHYKVYRNGEWLGDSYTESYEDLGLANGDYEYYVTAFYDGGESDPTNTVDVNIYFDPNFQMLDVVVFTDQYPGETTWQLADTDGNIVATDEGVIADPETLYEWEVQVFVGEYTWTIFDAYGDGICCAYGEGYYELYLNGELLGTGGEFTTDESVNFTVESLIFGTVNGTVTDDVGSPVGNTSIIVNDEVYATTSGNGSYSFDIFPETYDVTAAKFGYVSSTVADVDVVQDSTTVVDFVLIPAGTGTLAGTVTDAEDSAPMAGVSIVINGTDYSTLTDDAGAYLFDEVFEGTYDVTVSIDGYFTQTAEDVTIVEDETVTLDFAMEVYTFPVNYWNDFEENDGGLIANTGWGWGSPSAGPSGAYSGVNLWGTNLSGDYDNNANYTLETTEEILIANSGYMLEFWHYYDIENYWDGGNVKISTNGGNSWEILDPIGGYPEDAASTGNAGIPGEPCFTDNSGGWVNTEFDLSAYAGQIVYFRWHFGTDGSVQYPGWYIDDVRVYEQQFGSLDGVVTESASGAPIFGAVVTVSGLTGTTNSDGYYTINNVVAFTYDAVCNAEGYNVNVTEVEVIPDMTTTLDFALTAPTMDIDPQSLSVVIDPNEIHTEPITISNNGNGLLEWRGSIATQDREEFDTDLPLVSELRDALNLNIPKSYRSSGLAPEAPLNPPLDQHTVLLDRDTESYAYNAYDPTGSIPAGPISFYLENPGSVTPFGSEASNFIATADWVDDVWYGVIYGGTLITIDMETGEYTTIGSTADVMGMAYDWTTETMYGVAFGGELYTIDLETGAYNQIATTQGNMITMACSNDGILYGFDLDADTFGMIDKVTGEWTVIGSVGFDFSYAQDASFDHATNTLYWAAYDVALGGELVTVDLETGAASLVGAFPGGLEATGFAIPGRPDTWLTIEPNSGVLDAGASGTVVATFDGTDILPGTTLIADITFAPTPEVGDVTIPVTLVVGSMDFGSVSGNVSLENTPYSTGNMSDVIITIGPYTTTPNDNGSYSFAVYPGTYEAMASLYGYEDAVIGTVVVEEGAETSGINFDMNCLMAGLSGTVAEYGTGIPISGATITFFNMEMSDVTDGSGHYEFLGIIEGTYELLAEHDAYEDVFAETNVSQDAMNVLDMTMQEHADPPLNLTAEVLNYNDVHLAWSSPVAGGGDADVLVQIFTDGWPSETSWDIVSEDGTYIDGIETGSLTEADMLYEWPLVLEGGTYTFTIYDAYGDGICCAYGEGYYNVLVNGDLIATGGEFATEESVTFNTSGMVNSITHSAYAEPHDAVKGELPENYQDLPLVTETTEYNWTERNREFLGYNVYRNNNLIAEDISDTTYVNDNVPNGTYVYGVKAVYSSGISEPATVEVIVDAPLIADFSADVTEGASPLSVNFTDESTEFGSPVVAWYWEFGDGETSNEQNPTHVYEMMGSYTVTFIIMDLGGTSATETKEDYITVTAEPGPCEFARTIDVTGNGITYDLTFGFASYATDGYDAGIDQYAPPPPPPPSFDAALGWEGDRYFKQILATDCDVEKMYTIQLQYASDNLITLEWDNTGLAELGLFRLTDAFDGALGVDVDMTEESSLVLDNNAYTTLKLWVTAVTPEIEPGDVPEGFEFTETPFSGVFQGQANIDGLSAVEEDWVAAFDADGNCAGSIQLTLDAGIAYINLPIYGDDPATSDIDEGMNAGEAFTLTLFDASENAYIDYGVAFDGWFNNNGAPIPPYNDPTVVYDFLSVLELTDEISLAANWNLVSFDVNIENNAPATVFADLIADGNLEYVTGFGEGGATFFDPNGLPFLNTLTSVDANLGYWVKSNTSASVAQNGVSLVGSSFDLSSGWNLIAYTPQGSMTPSEAFADIISDGNLVYVTGYNAYGAVFFDPNGPDFMNTLTSLDNGSGYWVKVNNDVAGFTYPTPSGRLAKTFAQNINPNIVKTNQFMFVNGEATFDHVDYKIGNKVNVYASSGILIGEMEILEGGLLRTGAVYGNDVSTDIVDGANFGESLIFRIGELESEPVNITFTGSMNLTKVSLTFKQLPETYALSPNYPNPFNPVTTIQYNLPDDAHVSMVIYDIMGRQVRTLVNDVQNAGYRTVKWNATNEMGQPVSAGMYFYVLKADDFTQIRKMVLLK